MLVAGGFESPTLIRRVFGNFYDFFLSASGAAGEAVVRKAPATTTAELSGFW
jgi:hypothetical protein